MKTTAIIIVCLLSTSAIAQQRGTVNWNGLRELEVGTPNQNLNDAAKQRWYTAQLKRAFAKSQKPVFVGNAKVTSITEKDGKWTVTAVRELTDDEQLKHRLRIIKQSSEPVVGSFSSAALAAQSYVPSGPSVDREPSVTWTVDKKPKYAKGHVMEVGGDIIGATWDNESITAIIRPNGN